MSNHNTVMQRSLFNMKPIEFSVQLLSERKFLFVAIWRYYFQHSLLVMELHRHLFQLKTFTVVI